jgi:Spx/MgsR family transcriptional regulator
MSVDLYGIKSCDKVRSATKWLIANKIDFNFIDLKSTKLNDIEATYWLKKIEWSQLINKRSLTWKALTNNEKAKILDINSARSLIVNQPLVIKRPVIKYGKELIVGFSEKKFREVFEK